MSIAEATAELTAPGQLFEMAPVEVDGIKMRAWKAAPPTLRSVLDLSLAHGEADFVVYEGERTTFADHYRSAATLAGRLHSELGIRRGQRIAICMRNLPEWVTTFWAATAAGAVVVPLNGWWTGEELAFGLNDSGAVVAFCDTERAESIEPWRRELPDLRTVVVADERRRPSAQADTPEGAVRFAELLGQVGPDALPPDVDLGPDDLATILYTSGTSGRPRGVPGTHRNACSALMSLFFAATLAKRRTGAGPLDTAPGAQSCHLLTVPLFHATGCHAVLVPATAAGSKLVMMHHFDPVRALELVEHERVSALGGVPTVVARILECPDLARRDVSSIRSVTYGGAPAPRDLAARVRQAFALGQPGNGYGLTETSGVVAMVVGDDYLERPGSVGVPVPVTDVAVVPEGFSGDEPESLPPGQAGELWVKGPQVASRYWNRPDETARSVTRGWLHTGDIASIDPEGFVSIVDRAKDVIIRGGENVYPGQVEQALCTHPAVLECAVIGVAHPTLGEEVGAVVVLRPGHKVAADELSIHSSGRLARYMIPTRYWYERALPRNPAGKVPKRALRAAVLRTGEGAPWAAASSAWDDPGRAAPAP